MFDHTRAVIDQVTALCERAPFSSDFVVGLKEELILAAALHDLGKAAIGFQQMLTGEAENWNKWRHEILSASLASGLDLPETTIFAILTHHKQIPGDYNGTLAPMDDVHEKMLRELLPQADAIAELWAAIANSIGRPDLVRPLSPQSKLNLAAAWLDDSYTSGQRVHIPFEQRYRASLLRGLLISADHLASGHRTLPPPLHAKEYHPKPEIKLRHFQEECAGTRGHVILRAPTGSGKTEAALLWAARNQHEHGRLFYVLPNRASINAMHARLQREFPTKANSIGLLHSRAAHHLLDSLNSDYPNDPRSAQAESVARARLAKEMYHPARVCTPHQLLRYALHGRGWELMLSEIPGACVIFDEIHSYDPELAGLTLGAAGLFAKLGAQIMFISATLPAFLETELRNVVPGIRSVTPNPAYETDREILGRMRHEVSLLDGTLSGALPEIVARADSGEHVLVVCNHVRTAQEIFKAIRSRCLHENLELLHGRFNARDRQLKERKLSSSNLPRILVATQVVEVSLDVSFDVGFFEPAPIDALAQRMGRVNRQGTTPRPIFICREPINKHPLYNRERTDESLKLFTSRTGPITEQALVEIANEIYRSGYSVEDRKAYEERLHHPYFVDFENRLMAGRHQDWVKQVIDPRSDGQVEVLPESLIDEYQQRMKGGLWLEADGLLVSVYPNGKWERIDRSGDPWTIDARYSELGLET